MTCSEPDRNEDAYGTRKRIAFVSQVIADRRPATVLDVGCGTGNQLTRPLADQFPKVQFLGVDSDPGTIAYAREANTLPNLSFDFHPSGTFDLIIASEVLEHVEDPVEFLRSLRARLTTESGRVVITTPNGFGPFELAAAAEQVLHGHLLGPVSRATSQTLRRIKHGVSGAPDVSATRTAANTFAISPHINFFTLPDVAAVARGAGFTIEEQRSRTLVCGYGFDRIVKGRVAQWNAKLADAAPPSLSSGWMFLLAPADTGPGAYLPGRWARWKRRRASSSLAGTSHGHDRLPA